MRGRCAILLALTASCGGATVERATTPTDTLAWRVDSLNRTFPECADSTTGRAAADSLPCASIDLAWIVVTSARSPAISDSVTRIVRSMLLAGNEGTMHGSPDALAADFFNGYRTFRTDVPDASVGWFDDRDVSVACNTPDDFVLRFTQVSFLGGAHPNGHTVYAAVDPMTGASRDWRSLVDTAVLRPVVERHFRRVRELPDTGSINDHGWFFENDRFALPIMGMRCNGALTLQFNAYDVGPYAVGPTELIVPVAEVPSIAK